MTSVLAIAHPCNGPLGDLNPNVLVEFTPFEKKEPAVVKMKDLEDDRFFAQGTVTKEKGRNLLDFVIVLKTKTGQRSKNLYGREAFTTIINEFESKKIKIDAFEATWTDNMKFYEAPSDNLVAFAVAYKKAFLEFTGETALPELNQSIETNKMELISISAVQAALATWTGQQISATGFKHLESIEIVNQENRIGSDGYIGRITVRVLWSKKPEPKFSFKDSGSRGKSALPRFHDFIKHLTQEREER